MNLIQVIKHHGGVLKSQPWSTEQSRLLCLKVHDRPLRSVRETLFENLTPAAIGVILFGQQCAFWLQTVPIIAQWVCICGYVLKIL
jgi:hypothetical protein